MDTEVDLTTVDRDVLIAIIAELQAVIARLEKRIVQLEGQAKPANSRRMPGLKPNAKADRKPAPPKGLQAKAARLCPRPHDAHVDRWSMWWSTVPTAEPSWTVGPTAPERSSSCPKFRRVTEHVYVARICPGCRRRCLPPTQLDGVVMGKQRLGVNLLSADRHAAGRGAFRCPSAASSGI